MMVLMKTRTLPRMKVQLAKQIQMIINHYVGLSVQVRKIRSTGSIVIVVENVKSRSTNVKRATGTIVERIAARENQIDQQIEN